jgi:protoheme IX farnesyltransferase
MSAVPVAAPEVLEQAADPPLLAPRPGWATDYRTLMKPRITLLVVLTTLAAMVWAADGAPPLGLTLATLLGMTLASGGASALNHVWDRDIDRLMTRRRNGPWLPDASRRVPVRCSAWR